MLRVVRAGSLALSASIAVVALGGCGAQMSDGPIIKVCHGPNFGRPVFTQGDGPIYLNISRRAPTSPIRAALHTPAMYLRISANCSLGAAFSVANPAVVGVRAQVEAENGAAEVISVSPDAVGDSVIRYTPPSSAPQSVVIQVLPPIVQSPASVSTSSP